MKRFIFTLSLLFSICYAQAQWTFEAYGEYDYTRTSGSGFSLAAKGDYQFNKTFKMPYEGLYIFSHSWPITTVEMRTGIK